MLTDDEIRKAAGSAAEQMWPEAGYVGWTKDDSEFHRLFLEACIAKLTAGVEMPAPTARFNWNLGKFEWLVTFKHSEHHLKPLYTRDQLLQYGAAQRLAGREQDKADAERYQWLQPALISGGALDDDHTLTKAFQHMTTIPTKEEFNAAIDAAMKRGEA